MMPAGAGHALVVCIGNDLAGDDAVGCEMFHALGTAGLPDNVSLIALGVGGIAILDHLNGMFDRLIIVDAVRWGGKPGTVYRHALASLPVNHRSAVSAHGVGIREMIEAGKVLYPDLIPNDVFCIGIEGKNFDECGSPLSEPVRGAIGTAVNMIRETLGH
jgi:hydrogenase maturation protease